jgi:hypothetical protein
VATAEQPTELFVEEEERVWCWRYEQFLTLGLSIDQASQLAESDADLNRARSLIAARLPTPGGSPDPDLTRCEVAKR